HRGTRCFQYRDPDHRHPPSFPTRRSSDLRSHGCSTVETMIRRLIARAFWTVSRWKLVTEPAPKRPTVLVGAPHTSNWDFVLMLAIAWSLGVEVHWLGKHSLFA